MPSLKNLGDFKSSFANIGMENEIRIEQNLPEDSYPLPDHEPAELPELESPDEPDNNAEELLNFGDLGDLLGGSASENPEQMDFLNQNNAETDFTANQNDLTNQKDENGMNELLDVIPDDFGTPGENAGFGDDLKDDDLKIEEIGFGINDENLSSEPESSDLTAEISPELSDDLFTETAAEKPAEDDFNVPNELLSGLSDILETDEKSATDGLEFTDFEAGADEVQPEPFDISQAAETESFESADFPESIDISEPVDFIESPETAETGQAETAESIDISESIDFAESLETAEPEAAPGATEPAEAGEAEPADLDGFDLGGEFEETAEAAPESVDFAIPDIPEVADYGAEDNADDAGEVSDGINDFTLPGIDDAYNPRLPRGTETDVDEILGEPDEILLSEEEAAKLRDTLASYPLNLRIACEELITEEVVAPDQMSNLIRLLKTGASAKETAVLAGKILGRTIAIPKGFEKMTGEQLETEQASFAYIFVNNFLPVFRTFAAIAVVAACLGYLIWTFIYLPAKAESIYRRGYDRIAAGEYGRARELFKDAFAINQKKIWFYRYAEAYRDERQYLFAEEKYDELLFHTASKNKNGIPEKKAVLDYAEMETYYLRNYYKADMLLRRHILDYSIWDREALLALGDNNLAWGDIEPERYEDARKAYAILIERYGRNDSILERMLKYFIRTDNLAEVLPLQSHFMSSERRKITPATLAELGGYLLDKRTEEIRGIPNEFLDRIGGIREILLRAIRTDLMYPESYYHLSRYYNYYGSYADEELTLGRAIQAFDSARLETAKRLGYRIESLRRFAEIHIMRGEFFRGEEYLVKGAGLYEDGLTRRVIAASPKYGRLYADLGDLEFFIKDGNAAAALDYYRRSEQNGYSPPEIQYRMGAAHYQMRQWAQALERFAAASFPLPYNQRILYALGNASYMRGNYFAAQGYFDSLLEILEAGKSGFSLIYPSNNREEQKLTERLMVVQNNLGVTLEALTLRTGNGNYRTRALGLYSESERAWDILTRNPESMERLRPSPDIIAPGVNPAYLNVQNSLYPISGYEPLFFMRIDKDLLEPSIWEDIAPPGFRLAEGISQGR